MLLLFQHKDLEIILRGTVMYICFSFLFYINIYIYIYIYIYISGLVAHRVLKDGHI